MASRIKLTVVAVALGLLAVATWLHFGGAGTSTNSVPTAVTPPGSEPQSANRSAPPAVLPATGIQHPIRSAEGAAETARSKGIPDALIAMYGRKIVMAMFQLGDFPRRVVATVDNLGRKYAPSSVWPLNPAPGRFAVEHLNDSDVIAASNAARYTPYLRILDMVDVHRVVDFYVRFYPVFQQAYEGIGYPKGYFNDRLVEVLDQLLMTPEIATPVKVWLVDINGPERPTRPWVLYRFDDGELESLSAGQKILLRMGPAQERQVKAKLEEIRRLIVGAGPPR